MSSVMSRLARIEKHLPVPPRAADISTEDIADVRFHSAPAAPVAWHWFVRGLAMDRHLANYPIWYGLTLDEQRRRGAELEQLYTKVWDEEYARLADTQAIPEGLISRFETEFGMHEHFRRSSPLWQRVWPEWRPNLSLSERLAFDALLAEEAESRIAQIQQAA